jgi:hypothetical protein
MKSMEEQTSLPAPRARATSCAMRNEDTAGSMYSKILARVNARLGGEEESAEEFFLPQR